MTGLENIVNQIRMDAEEAARQQMTEASAKVTDILAEAKAYGEKRAVQVSKDSEALKADIIKRAESSAQLETRRTLLSTKQALISKTIKEALANLENLNKEEYFDVLLKLVAKYSTDENCELQLSKKDLARLPSDFTQKLSSGGKITVSQIPADINSGFLLIYGGIDVNCTFDALFADAADELQDTVSNILFA